MAAKLKLISKIIPWSLLLRAGVLAVVWLALPYWVFLVLALVFYFTPLFQSRRLLLPLGLFLVFAAFLPYGFWSALLLMFIFFLILGIKNLIVVDRAAAYETLYFVLFFLAALGFTSRFPSPSGQLFAASAGVSLVYALLLKNFLLFSPGFAALTSREKFFITALAGMIIWQWLLGVIFLPMNFFYQTALMFLGGVVLGELLFAYGDKSLGRRKILAYFSVFFVVVAILLAANDWQV
jgi:hypothetical protein